MEISTLHNFYLREKEISQQIFYECYATPDITLDAVIKEQN